MASASCLGLLVLVALASPAAAQLSSTFYDTSCPKAMATIKSAVTAAVAQEARMGASLLRLHFHDCFVQARLRRVPSAGGERAERWSEFDSERLQRHRQHQGAGGGRLQADRLLRRHPRHRRPRLRRRARRADLDCSAGEKGLAQPCELERGGGQPPSSYIQPLAIDCRVREAGPQPDRHGCPLRRAHDRAGALPELPGPHLQRHQHQPGVQDLAPGQLPRDRRRQRHGAAGHDDAQHVRQRLLQQPAVAEGAPALGPAALQRRQHRQHGPQLRVQPDGLQLRLRGGHGEHGQHQPSHGDAGADQDHMLRGQLVVRPGHVQFVGRRR